ncbi:MAG: hypothetical protein AAGA27_02185 [Pseudomonadota bacterium]
MVIVLAFSLSGCSGSNTSSTTEASVTPSLNHTSFPSGSTISLTFSDNSGVTALATQKAPQLVGVSFTATTNANVNFPDGNSCSYTSPETSCSIPMQILPNQPGNYQLTLTSSGTGAVLTTKTLPFTVTQFLPEASWTQNLTKITETDADKSTYKDFYYTTKIAEDSTWECPSEGNVGYHPSPMAPVTGTTDGSPSTSQTWISPGPINYTGDNIAAPLFDACGGSAEGSTKRFVPADIDEARAQYYDNPSTDVSMNSNVPLTAAGCTCTTDTCTNCTVYHGYIFGDNYFELYVNGHYVAHDENLFFEFDSSVVRFSVPRGTTPRIAIKAIDMHGMSVNSNGSEDNSWGAAVNDSHTSYTGLGFEANSNDSEGNPIAKAGDGGLIARFVNETAGCHDDPSKDTNSNCSNLDIVTNTTDWYAQVYTISPVQDKTDVKQQEEVNTGDGSITLLRETGQDIDTVEQFPCMVGQLAVNSTCYAARWAYPSDWYATDFSPVDYHWPRPTLYTANDLGEDKRCFCHFTDITSRPTASDCFKVDPDPGNSYDLWGNAKFIWGPDSVQDNLVLFVYDPSTTTTKK